MVVFMVQLSCCHGRSILRVTVPGSFDECKHIARCPRTLLTNPINVGCEPDGRLLPSTSMSTLIIALSPKAYTRFTVPRRVES